MQLALQAVQLVLEAVQSGSDCIRTELHTVLINSLTREETHMQAAAELNLININ